VAHPCRSGEQDLACPRYAPALAARAARGECTRRGSGWTRLRGAGAEPDESSARCTQGTRGKPDSAAARQHRGLQPRACSLRLGGERAVTESAGASCGAGGAHAEDAKRAAHVAQHH
jgi:hypothetical protein